MLILSHGGDMGSMLLGTGSSPFMQVMETLRDHGYTGTIVLENNYGALPLCAQAEDRFSLVEQDMKTVYSAMKDERICRR